MLMSRFARIPPRFRVASTLLAQACSVLCRSRPRVQLSSSELTLAAGGLTLEQNTTRRARRDLCLRDWGDANPVLLAWVPAV